jgi:predicted acylesterase/phospholipase RssA
MSPQTLIFSGGGLLGCVYIGLLKRVETTDDWHNVNEIISMSVGSIFALLYIIGYNSSELENKIKNNNIDFNEYNFSNVIYKYGVNSGESITNWITELMKNKNVAPNITLIGLYNKFKINYKIVVTDIQEHKLDYFSKDNTPNLKVIDAIRMAVSVPFLFTIKKYHEKIYIDAMIISNYPLTYILENVITRDNEYLGFQITSVSEKKKISSVYDYLQCIIKCKKNNNCIVYPNTVVIQCEKLDNLIFLDFELTHDTIDKYINYGFSLDILDI